MVHDLTIFFIFILQMSLHYLKKPKITQFYYEINYIENFFLAVKYCRSANVIFL